MKTCPQCMRKTEDAELVCGYCGYEIKNPAAAMTPAPTPTASEHMPPAVSSAANPSGPAVKTADLNSIQRLSVLAVLLVAIGAAGLITALRSDTPESIRTNQPQKPVQKTEIQSVVQTTGHEPATAAVAKWRGNRQPGWASDGSRTISFALEAENKVPVWMKSVRPVLTVRCLGGNTDVFVVTSWAASIESTADVHTVHVSFDDGPAADEQWLESDDAQALFAPNGVNVVRQLAQAHTMRFGFTPYNAVPVTAEFNVTGFDELIGLVSKTCRWKS